jgi:polyhydroxyalkanoate synthesis regulator phasin
MSDEITPIDEKDPTDQERMANIMLTKINNLISQYAILRADVENLKERVTTLENG